MTDPADVLRDLAADLEADARGLDPTNATEGGVAQGLGRAAGKAEARAQQLEEDG